MKTQCVCEREKKRDLVTYDQEKKLNVGTTSYPVLPHTVYMWIGGFKIEQDIFTLLVV